MNVTSSTIYASSSDVPQLELSYSSPIPDKAFAVGGAVLGNTSSTDWFSRVGVVVISQTAPSCSADLTTVAVRLGRTSCCNVLSEVPFPLLSKDFEKMSLLWLIPSFPASFWSLCCLLLLGLGEEWLGALSEAEGDVNIDRVVISSRFSFCFSSYAGIEMIMNNHHIRYGTIIVVCHSQPAKMLNTTTQRRS